MKISEIIYYVLIGHKIEQQRQCMVEDRAKRLYPRGFNDSNPCDEHGVRDKAYCLECKKK